MGSSDRTYGFGRVLMLFSILGMMFIGWLTHSYLGPSQYVTTTWTVTSLSFQTVTQPQAFTVTVPTMMTVTERSVWTVTERSYITVPTYIVVTSSAATTVSGGTITGTGPPVPAGSIVTVAFTHYSWNTSIQLEAILVDMTTGYSTSMLMRYDPSIYNPYLQYKYTATLGITAGKEYAIVVKRISTSPAVVVFYQAAYFVNRNITVLIS